MPSHSSSQELTQAITALQKSIYILIIHYKGYIKFIILTLFVYVFYTLGNRSVKDERMNQKLQLTALIQRRIAVRVEIPKKIQKIRQVSNTILVLAVLLLLIYSVGYYMKMKIIKRNSSLIVGSIVGSTIVILTLLNLNKYFLNRKFRQNDSLQRNISKHLTEFQTSLGPKVNKLLKNHLCKSKISKLHSSLYSIECVKPDCKQLRKLYKVRIEAIEELVNEAINFEWCSICKKSIPFDECLGFQYKPFQERGDTEEEQARNKMVYLYQGIEKMHRWLSLTSPCNCSKIYWTTSTQKILSYKKEGKQIDAKIKLLEAKNID